MKTVFKYPLIATDNQVVYIPSEKILSVRGQGSSIVLYALVDTDKKEEVHAYEIGINGTGNLITFDVDNFTFLGTVKIFDGRLMFHVFYKKITD